MKNDGKNFEKLTKKFFSFLFNKLGYIVHKERIQFNGTQDGFDVQIAIGKDYKERIFYIECKDYSKDVNFASIVTKSYELLTNYKLSKNDMALFVSPKSDFKNSKNAEKSEPTLNGIFPFNIRLLEKSNGIKNLFALNKDIYKEIYKQELSFEINEEEEIEKFKSIIFSRGKFRKIIVNAEDKEKFIPNAKKCTNYIPRNLIKERKTKPSHRYLFHEDDDAESLITIVKDNISNPENDGLALLGNPGLGKSVELAELALYFWENREETSIIPFYRVINSFTVDSKISDFLPKDWDKIPNLLIILDGLDEISYINEFKAKLQNFISNNKDELQNIYFVLSCRTNIYENIVKGIPKFECFFLAGISYQSAISHLQSVFKFPRKVILGLYVNEDQKEFLENPFYLNLFGEYYSENSSLPKNKTDLIEKYVDKRLEEDRIRKFQNKEYDKSIILSACKKTALTIEAMQSRVIEDSELTMLIPNHKAELINSCFIEKVYNSDKWQFEHKNLQEFFVAKALLKLPFEEIISFISLNSENKKTHPSWLNSITYLINSLDSTDETYIKLIDWLKKNDSEVLFKSDSDRISIEIRSDVFQEYFIERCKNNTLWIRTNDNETRKIAEFGDNNKNIDFLISEINNKANHRRTRISAFDLLTYMNLYEREKEIKAMFLKFLDDNNKDFDLDAKSDLLRLLKRLSYHLDEEFFTELLSHIEENDYHRTFTSILECFQKDLFTNEKSIDPNNHIDYIKNVAKVISGDKERKHEKDRNIASNERQNLKNVLLQFHDIDDLLFALDFLLIRKDNYHLNDSEIINLVKRLSLMYSEDEKVFDKVVNFIFIGIEKRKYLFEFEKRFCEFFKITNTRHKGFLKFYELREKIGVRFMSYIATDKCIRFLTQEYKNNNIKDKTVLHFRNNLSYEDLELSLEFQRIILEETSYDFEGDILEEAERTEWQEFNEVKESLSFDLLFDKNKIKGVLKTLFKNFGADRVNWELVDDFRKKYWKNLELQKSIPQSAINIVHDALHLSEFKHVTFDDVFKLVNSELYLINKIKEVIHSKRKNRLSQGTRQGTKITRKQYDFINNWCQKAIKSVKLKSESIVNKEECGLIWYFRNLLNLEYPEEILLELLEVDGIMNFNEQHHGIDYISKLVDKSKVDNRIVKNIEKGFNIEQIRKNHFIYAIDNRLKIVYPIIEDYLLDNNRNHYFRKEILKKYCQSNLSLDLLKRIADNTMQKEVQDDIIWIVLDILIENNESGFVIDKILHYYDADEKRFKELISIKYLIKANYEKAFLYFNNWIKEQKVYTKKTKNSLRTEDFPKHTNQKSIPYIIELINTYYDNNEFKFDEYSNPIRFIVESITAIAQNNSLEVCKLLIKELERCRESLNKIENDLYYINQTLLDLKDIKIKVESKPMTFHSIARKINECQYYFA
ncbi:NACHT domain-containing protein [Winogradskyella pulchriflava]|uniref:NACHT domain-containing protein n=1 Tax=Winogradskyella pulchriflava TaxID=1110688 RepID=A0ABV6QAN6_9FLAO